MTVVYVLLLLVALICFLAAAANVVVSKVHLVALGLFFATLVPFIQQIKKV